MKEDEIRKRQALNRYLDLVREDCERQSLDALGCARDTAIGLREAPHPVVVDLPEFGMMGRPLRYEDRQIRTAKLTVRTATLFSGRGTKKRPTPV